MLLYSAHNLVKLSADPVQSLMFSSYKNVRDEDAISNFFLTDEN